MVGLAVTFYLLLPLWEGNRSTPTPLSYNGNLYYTRTLFLTIYFGQILHGFCVFLAIGAYDAIFIQCIMVMTYKFRAMTELLRLLAICDDLKAEEQKEILVDIYKIHLNVLE